MAPFETAQNFDNVGLLVGSLNDNVKTVLLALDLTASVLEEANKIGANLILTHHPIIFKPVKSVLKNSVLFNAIKLQINVVAMHTNLDIAPQGVSFCLAKELNLQKIEILENSDNFGRVGFLSVSLSCNDFLKFVCEKLGCVVKATKCGGIVEKVAVVSGSGGFALSAACQSGAHALVTGECRHSDFVEAFDRNFCLVAAGHFETEVLFCEPIKKQLESRFNNVKFVVAKQVSPAVVFADEKF